MATLFLLYPEWQGCGRSPSVYGGALAIARELLPGAPFLTIESPGEEQLERNEGVVGLRSIAPRFRETLGRLRDKGPESIVTIGGTCGVEAAPVAYLNERYQGDLAVVWLDAHGDLNTPASSPSGHFHGMVLRTLLGDGPEAYVRNLRRPLQPRQVFLAATRDLDPPEREFIDQAGISVTSPDELRVPGHLAERVRAGGFRQAYVHLDLDALDPREFPDTLIPTDHGSSLADIRAAIGALVEICDVVGFSLVEYVPRSPETLVVLQQLLDCIPIVSESPSSRP